MSCCIHSLELVHVVGEVPKISDFFLAEKLNFQALLFVMRNILYTFWCRKCIQYRKSFLFSTSVGTCRYGAEYEVSQFVAPSNQWEERHLSFHFNIPNPCFVRVYFEDYSTNMVCHYKKTTNCGNTKARCYAKRSLVG